jgi:hypothetical protein
MVTDTDTVRNRKRIRNDMGDRACATTAIDYGRGAQEVAW